MEIVQVLLKQCLIMLMLIITGYILYRKKLVTDAGSRELSNILVRIIIPCVIINAYLLADFSMKRVKGLAIMTGLSLLALVIAMIVSYLIFGKRKRVENFSAAFCNAGFMGIPLVSATLGTEAVFYVAVFVALLNIFQWTYGLVIMTGNRKFISPRKIITNPVVIGFVIAIAGFLIPVHIPALITIPVSYVGAMNTPVAMIVLGVYLAQTDMRQILKNSSVWWCSIVRLVIIPAITIAVMMLIPLTKEHMLIKQTALIAAVTPVGSNVAIFAKLYGTDYEQSVRVVCLSTILCIVTMPCMMYIANMCL